MTTRANPKKAKRKQILSQRTFTWEDLKFFKDEMFWSTFELFYATGIYALWGQGYSDEEIANWVEATTVLIEEKYEGTMELKDFVRFVEKETGIGLVKDFKRIRNGETIKEEEYLKEMRNDSKRSNTEVAPQTEPDGGSN